MELESLTPKNKARTALVKQLRPFLDDQHLIRSQGRTNNAPVSELTKFPVLLPTYHPFTKLVVLSTHVQQLHSGVNSTLAAIRQRFWIPKAKKLLKNVLRKCVICRKQGGKLYLVPDSPPLPTWRLEDLPPFTIQLQALILRSHFMQMESELRMSRINIPVNPDNTGCIKKTE